MKTVDDRTTLLDIAKCCNLSKSTVSRVLNGNAGNFRIAPETTEKVLQSAKMLNYRPNRLARAINNRRTHLIGMSVAAFTAENANAERQFANDHRIMGLMFSAITQHPLFVKYDLVLHNRNEYTDIPPDENDMQQDLLDGMIYANPSDKHLPFLKMLSQSIPLVILGSIRELHDSVICVDINNHKMARQATEHLLSIGRKNIMLLVPEGVLSAYCIQDRIDGYHKALEQAGLKANPDLIRILRADVETVSHFIRTNPTIGHIDAILCLTDRMSIFCIEPLRERGLRIPEDVALMGFNGSDMFSNKAAQLSTVKVPFHSIAYEATSRLLSTLEDNEPYTPGFYEVPAELVIHGSTVKN